MSRQRPGSVKGEEGQLIMGLPARFWTRVVIDDQGGPSPCLTWAGGRNSWGYGYIRLGGQQLRVHRVAYEALVGPIPAGLVIDHLCRVRHCVNPEHLEPVTHRVNVLRGESAQAVNAAKTHCMRGHEFTPENTRRRPSGRTCRACDRKRRPA